MSSFIESEDESDNSLFARSPSPSTMEITDHLNSGGEDCTSSSSPGLSLSTISPSASPSRSVSAVSFTLPSGPPTRLVKGIKKSSSSIGSKPSYKSALTTLGLISAKEKVVKASFDSELFASLINTKGGGSIVVIRFEKSSGRGSSWSERVLSEGIYKNESWTHGFGFDTKLWKWYDNDVPQLNSRGYPIRLFIIRLTTRPSVTVIYELGRRICDAVNAVPRNNTTLRIDESRFMWIPQPTAWQAVIGSSAAYDSLMNELDAQLPVDDDFYHRNQEVIHSYFATGTFNLSLARALKAPKSELHPSVIESMNAREEFNQTEVEESDDDSVEIVDVRTISTKPKEGDEVIEIE